MGRTIGILGGMGPQATIDLFQWILRLATVEKEADYPRVLIDSNPAIPDRTKAILSGGPSPVPVLRTMLQGLVSAGAEVVGMPCNTAHYFIEEIKPGFSVEIVNMLQETALEIARQGLKTVGLLGTSATLATGVYAKYLTQVQVILPSLEETAALMEMIYQVKRGEKVMQSRLNHIIEEMDHRVRIDGVILGCSELPLIIASPEQVKPVLINPTMILAKALVMRACQLI